MNEPISVTVSSGVAISAKSTSKTPGDHLVLIFAQVALQAEQSVAAHCQINFCRAEGAPRGIRDQRGSVAACGEE